MARAEDDNGDVPELDQPSLGLRLAARPGDAEAFDREDEALVAKLRALPPEGREPDWKVMETALRAELREHPMPLPWWRTWRYLVPLSALAVTAGIALVVVVRTEDAPARTSMVTTRDAGALIENESENDSERPVKGQANALWLDGEAVDIEEIEAAELEVADPIAGDDDAGGGSDDNNDNDDAGGGILPVTDYGWIDTLDDDAIARVESWLARKRS